MSVVSSLWQICFVSIILAFGIEIGLFSKLTKLNKKAFLLLCIIYSIIIYISTVLLSGSITELSKWAYNSTMIIYLLIGIIMMIIGLFIIKETNNNKPQISKFIIITNIAMFFCCIISIIMNIIIISTMVNITLNEIRIFTIALLLISMILTYLISKNITRTDESYSRVLGNYMLLFGEYFILSALIMPNISIGMENTKGITIHSSEYLIYLIIMMSILFIIGVILSRKKSLLK